MAFDPTTVFASAVISAIVGGMVSLATASWVTGRQESARRRIEARHSVRDGVADVLRATREVQRGMAVPPEQARDALMADYRLASVVLARVDWLGWFRRKAVRRRLKRVVGRFAYDQARDLPYTDDKAATAVMVSGFLKTDGTRYDVERLGGLRRAAFGDGNRKKPDLDAAAKLETQLKRISRCWWI